MYYFHIACSPHDSMKVMSMTMLLITVYPETCVNHRKWPKSNKILVE